MNIVKACLFVMAAGFDEVMQPTDAAERNKETWDLTSLAWSVKCVTSDDDPVMKIDGNETIKHEWERMRDFHVT